MGTLQQYRQAEQFQLPLQHCCVNAQSSFLASAPRYATYLPAKLV